MAMFENFPYTNLHELNLDWLIQQMNMIKETAVISVNGQTGEVLLYQDAEVRFPAVDEDRWTIIRSADGTACGIRFINDGKAYIVHGSQLDRIYSANNPPDYPVTSVNGQTGDIELYTDNYVQLPTLNTPQIHAWNIFRTLNGVARGIQFNDDGSAELIVGTQRYVLYTSNNQPPYPVTSVNGKTGTVLLFTDSNGAVTFPALTNPDYEGWKMTRLVNGTNLSIGFNENGTVYLQVGNSVYDIYTSLNPQADLVTDRTAEVLEIAEDSPDSYWGLMRTTNESKVGILFDDADPDDPAAYLAYVDSNNQGQTVKLLTPADIPAGSGVITINGQYGVVTLYAGDIEYSSSDSRTIPDVISYAESCVAVVETSDTAVHNISVGQYVVWKDLLYKCTNAIVTGDALSASNLSPANTSAMDEINKILGNIKGLKFNEVSGLTISTSKAYAVPNGSRHLVFLFSGGGTTYDAMFMVNCTGAGAVTVIDIYVGSHISHAQSTNVLTITSDGTGNTGINLYDICVNGDVITG